MTFELSESYIPVIGLEENSSYKAQIIDYQKAKIPNIPLYLLQK